MINKVSDNGINFLMKEEGVVLHPYQDSKGVWTIGVGSTFYEDGTSVKKTDPPITKERAINLFRTILKRFEAAVYTYILPGINQNQFDALVSICYNIGIQAFRDSTLRKRVNTNHEDPKIKDAFLMWKNSDHKPVLLHRREREAELYFKQ